MRNTVFKYPANSFVIAERSLSLGIILMVALVIEASVFEGRDGLLQLPFVDSGVGDDFPGLHWQ